VVGEQMTKLQFFKYQATGNDFILIYDLGQRCSLSKEEIVMLCQRHFGIGADGLILVRPSQRADFKMVFFNTDGSEAEMCGNGIRCLAKYVYEYGLTSNEKIFVETLAGDKELLLFIEEGKVKKVKVDLGRPVFDRLAIPMLGGEGEVIDQPFKIGQMVLRTTCLSLGNPHCVIFVEDTSRAPVQKVGPIIEHSPLFPERTNVEFVQVLKRSEINLRVWERGVGETLACGTGACAAVVAGVRNGLTKRKAIVHLPGGDLEVEWANQEEVYLTGPAEEVFQGSICLTK